MTVVQLTKAQWNAQIRAAVPAWVWEGDVTIKAYALALAKVAEQMQVKVAEHVAGTFILTSTAGTLDTHGDERAVVRLEGELDPDYSVRVQNLFNQSNVPALSAFIDKILVAGTTRIQEDFNSVPFLDRDNFCNRAVLFLNDPIVNTFSIIVDKQIYAPHSYLDREYFADREHFAGTDISVERVFTLIKKIADDNKALGTFYRIFELLE